MHKRNRHKGNTVCFQKSVFNRKHSTERDNVRWGDSNGSVRLQCGRTIDLSLMGLKMLLQMGSPNSHITPWLVFYATGIVLLLYRPINRFYILTAAEGR